MSFAKLATSFRSPKVGAPQSVAAAGTTQATATAIPVPVGMAIVSTGAGGVALPTPQVINPELASDTPPSGGGADDRSGVIFVQNGIGATLSVYPSSSTGTINGGAAGAPVSLPSGKNGVFVCTSAANNTWMAIVSA